MRVLKSTTKTQGQRANDFCTVPAGELVLLGGFIKCEQDPDGPCGCARSVMGLHCAAATTTFEVTESDLTVAELASQISECLKPRWNSWTEANSLEEAKEIGRIAGGFPVGTVLEIRANRITIRDE